MVPPRDPCERSAAQFGETRWTWINDVRAGNEAQRMAALESLCQMYRLPLYCFARKRGLDPDESNDVVQECLAEVLRRNAFARADQAKGRLRTFLLLNMQQQISNWQRHARAQKRGGGARILSWEQDAEEFYGREPVDDQSPDKYFARTWARTLTDGVLESIRANWTQRGHAAHFDALRPFLLERLERVETVRLAAALELTPANVRVKLHRLRKEFATSVQKHVANTVLNPGEVAEELRELGLHARTLATPANSIR